MMTTTAMLHGRSLLLLLTAVLAPALAESPRPADPRTAIAERLDVRIEDIRPSPIPGLYEVRRGAEIGYVSADGRHYIDGDLFDIGTRDNLTELAREQGRVELLAGVRDDDAIVFAPDGPARHTITVFTDIDCQYCQKLHQDMAELNRLGIRVRYLMFPRGGPDTASWRKAEAVWCSADRRDALTRAKRGEAIKARTCTTPVADQYELGRRAGIHGTPGIISDRGEYIAGYLPPARLAKLLAGASVKADD
ncbi:MAG: DsbC family protein [Gammaproteobacteria bacterium]|nr:DsbC family protein [Gammaproteobacteria bacterium]